MDKHVQVMLDGHGYEKGPITPQMFGNGGREHMEKYGRIIFQEFRHTTIIKSFLMLLAYIS